MGWWEGGKVDPAELQRKDQCICVRGRVYALRHCLQETFHGFINFHFADFLWNFFAPIYEIIGNFICKEILSLNLIQMNSQYSYSEEHVNCVVL